MHAFLWTFNNNTITTSLQMRGRGLSKAVLQTCLWTCKKKQQYWVTAHETWWKSTVSPTLPQVVWLQLQDGQCWIKLCKKYKQSIKRESLFLWSIGPNLVATFPEIHQGGTCHNFNAVEKTHPIYFYSILFSNMIRCHWGTVICPLVSLPQHTKSRIDRPVN